MNDDTRTIRRQHTASASPVLEGRAAVSRRLFAAISGMIADWDRDGSASLTEDTLLMADLGFQSLDIVILMGELSRWLDRRDIPYERLLLVNGRPVEDLSLGVLTDFLWDQVGDATAGAA